MKNTPLQSRLSLPGKGATHETPKKRKKPTCIQSLASRIAKPTSLKKHKNAPSKALTQPKNHKENPLFERLSGASGKNRELAMNPLFAALNNKKGKRDTEVQFKSKPLSISFPKASSSFAVKGGAHSKKPKSKPKPKPQYTIKDVSRPDIVRMMNLANGTTRDDVRVFMETLGPVDSCRSEEIADGSVTAEVTFADSQIARVAHEKFNGARADGRVVRTKIVKVSQIAESKAYVPHQMSDSQAKVWEGPPLYSDSIRKRNILRQ